MSDVARLAGVSPATVSRVLYANGFVSAKKRKAVEVALEASGYRPNITARALRTSRSFTMGMVVSENYLNAFHPYVAHEVQREALARGYTVLTLNNQGNAEAEKAGVQRFLDQAVEALIFCAAVDPTNVHAAARSGIPCIQIEREVANGGILVLADPFAGLREAVAHLTGLGHVRIAYIGGALSIGRSEKPVEQSVEAMRLEAFRSAIRHAGLPVDDALIRLGPYYPRGDEEQPGAIHMRHLLQLPKPPTAVIAGSDLLAAGALQAINEAGRKVPEDFSIIGYDNTTAEILTPPLTSISQPIRELGQRAVQLAVAAIEGGGAEGAAGAFATRLVVRRSTARAPGDSNP